MSLRLYQVKNSNLQLRDYMKDHYSKPQGFVGRNLCYLVYFNETCYGAIVAGSATLHLAGRDDLFGLSGDKTQKQREIRTIINNTFFHLEKVNSKYPIRWQFTSKVLAAFRRLAAKDWLTKYGDTVIGFESLVELPRTGKIYEQDGWTEVGQTIGYTCKRTAGKGTDSWTGRRIWDTKNLRPKRVFCRLASLPIIQQAIHNHVATGTSTNRMSDEKDVPIVLDKMADIVLKYRPKEKKKKPRKRATAEPKKGETGVKYITPFFINE